MFEFFNKTEKLPRAIWKLLQPRKEFQKKTKIAFLAVFDATHPAGQLTAAPRRSHFTVFAKAVVACAALFAIFAGVSVYADTANVPADNALYPLKRLDENVQLALAPASAKPELQATFAARRAAEISDLSTRKPTSTIIAKLDSDLDSDVSSSVSAAAANNLGDGKLDSFCGKVLSAIATSSVALHGQLSIRANVLARFETECALNATSTAEASAPTSTKNRTGREEHGGFGFGLPSATSTLNTASGTIVHFRGGGSLNIIDATTTATTTPFHPRIGGFFGGIHI